MILLWKCDYVVKVCLCSGDVFDYIVEVCDYVTEDLKTKEREYDQYMIEIWLVDGIILIFCVMSISNMTT